MEFILASGSQRRLSLLKQIGRYPDKVIVPNIDESPFPKELPKDLSRRLALAKARKVFNNNESSIVIGADTVVARGRKILEQTNNPDQALYNLEILSGSRHRVYGSIAVLGPEIFRLKTVITVVTFKRFSQIDIERYLGSGEWAGKAGSYAVQGLAGIFVKSINGSYTNVVGLCLNSVEGMLQNIKNLKYNAIN